MSQDGVSASARLKSTFLKTDYTVAPYGLHWRSNSFFIVSTVAIGLFSDLFLYGLVVPVLPYVLQDRVGIAHDDVQGYVSGLLTSYAAASLLFSPVAGYIADHSSSRQAPFLGGLAALLIATILLFTSNTIPLLTIARIAQGMSSAVVWTVGLTLCIDTVGPENLGKTIGSIFSVVSVGELFAPMLGGILYHSSGLLAVGAVAVAILIVDLVMRVLVIEKKIAARYETQDPNADFSATSTQTRNATSEAVARAPNYGTTDEESTAANGHAADEEAPLIRKRTGSYASGRYTSEFHIPVEKLPGIVRQVPILYCLTSPSLLTSFIIALAQAIILASFDATIPLHVTDLFGFDSLQAGLLFAPLALMNLIMGPIGGWWVDRNGVKPAAVAGFIYLVPTLTLLRIPVAEPRTANIAMFSVFLALNGFGLGIIGAPSIVEAGLVVEKYHKHNPGVFGEKGPYAQLYGFSSMVFMGGMAIGPVIAGVLRDSIGYGNMNAVLAAMSAFTAVLSFVFLGGMPKRLRRKRGFGMKR